MLPKALTEQDLLNPDIRAAWGLIGHEFFAESGYPGKFNPEFFFDSWAKLTGLKAGVFFASCNSDGEPVGALGALFVPDLLTGMDTASEHFWFVTKALRGTGKVGLSLFNAYEAECDARKVRTRWMAHLQINEDALRRFYIRRGYRPADQFFRKDTL